MSGTPLVKYLKRITKAGNNKLHRIKLVLNNNSR